MFSFIVLFYILIVLIYIRISIYRKSFYSPHFVFVISSFIMFIGTSSICNKNSSADINYLIIMLLGVFSYIVGGFVFFSRYRVSRKSDLQFNSGPLFLEAGKTFGLSLLILIILSTIVTFLYFYAIGYNIFITSLLSLIGIGGGVSDPASMRLNMYCGDNYYAPGYVNQFKNIILPMCSAFMVFKYIYLKKKRYFFSSIVLVSISIIGLLGTGQRGAFARFALIMLLAAFFIVKSRKGKRFLWGLTLGSIVLFLLSSFFLGRASRGATGFDLIPLLFEEMWNRIFLSNQMSGLVGFRYVYGLPIQMGAEWFTDFLGILPGLPGSDLANRIFEIMYGTLRGTGPVSVFGSVYHNFGVSGIVCFFFLFGMLSERIYMRFQQNKKEIFSVLIYSGYTIILGTWIAGSPVQLLNDGLLAVFVTQQFPRILAYRNNVIKRYMVRVDTYKAI